MEWQHRDKDKGVEEGLTDNAVMDAAMPSTNKGVQGDGINEEKIYQPNEIQPVSPRKEVRGKGDREQLSITNEFGVLHDHDN